jgi:hypothetical protein
MCHSSMSKILSPPQLSQCHSNRVQPEGMAGLRVVTMLGSMILAYFFTGLSERLAWNCLFACDAKRRVSDRLTQTRPLNGNIRLCRFLSRTPFRVFGGNRLNQKTVTDASCPVRSGLRIRIGSQLRFRFSRRRGWRSTAGVYPPGNWFAPPGSNQSGRESNETAEASGAENR